MMNVQRGAWQRYWIYRGDSGKEDESTDGSLAKTKLLFYELLDETKLFDKLEILLLRIDVDDIKLLLRLLNPDITLLLTE